MATGTKRGCHDTTEGYIALTTDGIAINMNTPNSYLDSHKYSTLGQELLSLRSLHDSVSPYVSGWGLHNFSFPLHTAPQQHHCTSSYTFNSTDTTQCALV